MYGKCHGLEANRVGVGGVGNLLFGGAFTNVAGGFSSNGARGRVVKPTILLGCLEYLRWRYSDDDYKNGHILGRFRCRR